MLKYLLATPAAALLFSGAALAQEKVGGHTIYRGAEPSIWDGEATAGPLVHKATQASFAESIGDFKRTRVFAIDGGSDVSAGYDWARKSGAVPVTIYLFQPGPLPEHALKGALASLTQGRTMQIIWSDGPFAVDAPSKLHLFKGTYKTGMGPDAVMDYLYFGALGKWTVKVRATLPSPKDVAEERAIDAFVRALPWAQILAANGPCDGPACAADRPAPFDNHPAEMFLTQLAMSGQGKKIEGDTPLFSRKAGDAVWAVRTLDPVLKELFEGGFGAISVQAPLYTLSWRKDGKAAIVRFFTGTPSEDLFNRTVDSLVAHPEESAFVDSANAVHYVLD